MLFVTVKKSKYWCEVMKKHFNKELVIAKKDYEDLKTLINAGFVRKFMLMVMLK